MSLLHLGGPVLNDRHTTGPKRQNLRLRTPFGRTVRSDRKLIV